MLVDVEVIVDVDVLVDVLILVDVEVEVFVEVDELVDVLVEVDVLVDVLDDVRVCSVPKKQFLYDLPPDLNVRHFGLALNATVRYLQQQENVLRNSS